MNLISGLNYEQLFLANLGFVVLIETIGLLSLVRFVVSIGHDQLSTVLIIATGIAANTLTLPYVWFIFPRFIHERILYIGVSELFAVVVEAGMYALLLRRLSPIQSFLIAFICNALSFSFGLMLQGVS